VNVHLFVIHSSERPFICEICNQSFTQANTLCQHERIHTGQRPCICKICDKHSTKRAIYADIQLFTPFVSLLVTTAIKDLLDLRIYMSTGSLTWAAARVGQVQNMINLRTLDVSIDPSRGSISAQSVMIYLLTGCKHNKIELFIFSCCDSYICLNFTIFIIF